MWGSQHGVVRRAARGLPAEGRAGGVAALVLAGGRGRRMGGPKAFVLWRGETLLEHVLQGLKPLFDRVYVVAREREPFLHLGVPVVEDAGPQGGPLMGVYSGLLASGADWCFAVGCDMPLISPGAVRYMAGFLADQDAVVARIGGRVQPLHAFYSRGCAPLAARLLEEGPGSLARLVEGCRAHILEEAGIRAVDPRLLSFRDVDSARDLAGLDAEVAG